MFMLNDKRKTFRKRKVFCWLLIIVQNPEVSDTTDGEVRYIAG